MRTLTLTGMLVLAAGLGSCRTGAAAVETSEAFAPYDMTRPVQVYPRIKGEVCKHWILYFIGVGDDSVEGAIAAATKGSAKIDNVVGYQVKTETTYWLVGATTCTEVAGYPVIYKDSKGKWELFEGNMVSGKLVKKPAVVGTGGGEEEEPATPPAKTPPPKKDETPPAKTTPAASSGPSKKECEADCGNFATLWKGSDAIRSTIRAQCVNKCMVPENDAYRECIKGASKLEDITKCNNM